jgi:hypothetical protein
MNVCLARIVITLTVSLGLLAGAAWAEPDTKPSKKPAATADRKGSKSSSLIEKIKEVGNEASKGIHRASQGVRNIGDKAGKKTKEPIKEK